ncbi:MAG: MarR family transcriptional regulator [Alphaproteobacteria bacterium]|nr:MarR family transcriptional regulator [Alphaproteobacteria bacterium]
MSREKREALDRLVAAIRQSQTANDRMDEAFADLLGINRTDGRCLDIVQRLGQITAGELARQSGLTTGAVTAVIDRLEMAGYLRRIRDAADRRKVFVELTELAEAITDAVYRRIDEISDAGMGALAIEQLELIARFLHTGARLNAVLADFLRDYVDPQARDPVERLRAAKNFAARVGRERGAIMAEMAAAWNEPPPDIPSGRR